MIFPLHSLNTFSPLSFSQVLTLVIQQSMLHNTSSCFFWNTQAAGRGHVSTVSHKQVVCVKTDRQHKQRVLQHQTEHYRCVPSANACLSMMLVFLHLEVSERHFTCILTVLSGVSRRTEKTKTHEY